jgi:hypothetical protein
MTLLVRRDMPEREGGNLQRAYQDEIRKYWLGIAPASKAPRTALSGISDHHLCTNPKPYKPREDRAS